MENALLAFEVRLLKVYRSSGLEEQLGEIQSTRQELRRELQRVNQQLFDKDSQLASKNYQLSELDEQLTQKTQDVERLILWFEELHAQILALLDSRPWKVG